MTDEQRLKVLVKLGLEIEDSRGELKELREERLNLKQWSDIGRVIWGIQRGWSLTKGDGPNWTVNSCVPEEPARHFSNLKDAANYIEENSNLPF